MGMGCGKADYLLFSLCCVECLCVPAQSLGRKGLCFKKGHVCHGTEGMVAEVWEAGHSWIADRKQEVAGLKQPQGPPLKTHFLQDDSNSYRLHSLSNQHCQLGTKCLNTGTCVCVRTRAHVYVGVTSHSEYNSRDREGCRERVKAGKKGLGKTEGQKGEANEESTLPHST